jgi:hypothetical protein
MSLALDGAAIGTFAADQCTLTTGGAGDIIVMMCYGGNGLFTPADVAGLTWTTVLNVMVGPQFAAIAWAYSPGVLTSDTIGNSAGGGYTIDAVAIAGANITSPIDSTSPADSATLPFNLTTTAANTLVLCASTLADPPATPATGFTLVDGGSANFYAVEYEILSSAGVQSLNFAGGSPSNGFAVAVVAAPDSGSPYIPNNFWHQIGPALAQ